MISKLMVTLAVLAATPLAAQDYIAFKSPSGNILCAIYDDAYPGARCDMLSLTPSYTQPPAECDFDWGASFYIASTARAGELACVSDVVANPSEAQVLPYGAGLSFGGITCQSEKTGITCINSAGHGFTLSKARQRLF